jgi:hypothetical protein
MFGPEMTVEDLAKLIALWQQFVCPVVLMGAALCGHPDSVSFWEDKCNKEVCEVGYQSFGSEWPSVFYHKELKLLLTIYVDDFKLAGPSKALPKLWKEMRERITLSDPTKSGKFLGCDCKQFTHTFPAGGDPWQNPPNGMDPNSK